MTKKQNLLAVATAALLSVVIIFGVVIFKQIATINNSIPCGGEGLWIEDSQGNKSFVSMDTYVDRPVYAVEEAETIYGLNYSKEGVTTLLNIDCDVKEAFEVLDSTRMLVSITIGDVVYHRAYAKGSDGFTYLVETDEYGTILRDKDGHATIISRCDFADLYLGED